MPSSHDSVSKLSSTQPPRHRGRRLSRSQAALLAGGLSLLALTVLTLAVVSGATQSVDDQLFRLFRPDDQWATGQVVMNEVVWVLNPVTVLLVALAVGALTSWRRGSWRPAALALSATTAAALLVGVMQPAIGRLDAHGDYFGGSFPSGHTVATATTAGFLVLLHDRWGTLPRVLVAGSLASIVIGLALLVQGSHWGSDVLGGALIATTILACVWWLRGSADEQDAPQP